MKIFCIKEVELLVFVLDDIINIVVILILKDN